MQHSSAQGEFIYKINVYSYQQLCKYNFFSLTNFQSTGQIYFKFKIKKELERLVRFLQDEHHNILGFLKVLGGGKALLIFKKAIYRCRVKLIICIDNISLQYVFPVLFDLRV